MHGVHLNHDLTDNVRTRPLTAQARRCLRVYDHRAWRAALPRAVACRGCVRRRGLLQGAVLQMLFRAAFSRFMVRMVMAFTR